MPTYEYRCTAGHDFQLVQRMSDKPKTKCPVCGKAASRLISGGSGLIFKGSGFYITDYGKDGKGARKPEAEGVAAASEGTPKAESGAKAETAAAPAAAAKPEPATGKKASKKAKP